MPALFDVKGATSRLRAGEIITLDASQRRIYDGVVQALLDRTSIPPASFLGSPVYRALEEVAKLVLPLNLLDPEGPDFKPKSCETLHDITRYSHEKAVEEMFAFGLHYPFPGRESRQLLSTVIYNTLLLLSNSAG